jgi:hypothetical protein
MRAIISILIVGILVAIAAIATGFVKITNFRGQPPALTATRNSVSVGGGQAPAFDVQAGSVKVGTKDATVKVPTSVEIRKPQSNEAAAATNNAM